MGPADRQGGKKMPTNRTRRTRKPKEQPAQWVEIFLTTGEAPEKGTPAYCEYLGWKFFNEQCPGLPPAHEMADKIYGR